ncbi:MAG: DUF4113 domain-containing protein, partial [Muribaculaceae bacterium]|nr:DUF4113 domain-containing protein [Muribaculaceae bacterium]
IEKVLRKYPIEDVWGIGRRTSPKLKAMGVNTAFDYTQLSENVIRNIFGIAGLRTWKELQSIPCIEFEDGFEAKQSICVSRSFSSEIYDIVELREQIANFASSLSEKLRNQNSVACELSVFAYTNRFKQNERQMYGNRLVQIQTPTNDQRAIVNEAVAALEELFSDGFGYKKAGVVATRIVSANGFMRSLFDDVEVLKREQKLTSVVDSLNRTFGRGALKLAIQGSGKIKTSSENQSPHYTTLWSDIPKVSVK